MGGPTPGTRVAIVDDDESLCRSMSRLLRASGLNPSAFRSAEEFLDGVSPADFDCLVLDIQLSGISGIELSERLGASGCRVPPVIFITAQDEPRIRERAVRSGCAAYLSKSQAGGAVLAAITAATHGRSAPTDGGSPSSPGRPGVTGTMHMARGHR